MPVNWIGFVLLLVLQKSGDLVLELLLTKFWQWALRDDNLKHLTRSLTLQILIWYLAWLLNRTPLQEVSEKLEKANKTKE